jgi:hypothetical protein
VELPLKEFLAANTWYVVLANAKIELTFVGNVEED